VSARSILLGLPLLAACALGACSQVQDDETVSTENGLAAKGRWALPKDVLAVGAKVKIPYDDAPKWSSKACGGKLLAGAGQLGEFLRDEFDAVTSIGGYACRPNTANKSKMSVHGTGRALDVFIPKVSGGADNTRGDEVANWLVTNSERIGVQMVIWDRTVWMANGKNDKAYSGPHPHDDHIHVELTEEAAALKTAWFTEGPSGDGGLIRRDGGASLDTDSDGGESDDQDGLDPDHTGDIDPPTKDPGTKPPQTTPPQTEPPQTTPDPTSRRDASAPSPSGGNNDAPQINEEGTHPSPPSKGRYPDDAEDDGPGEPDSLKTQSKKEKKPSASGIESSGCGVAPISTGRRVAPMLLAVVLAASLVRRRRRS
jgi:hypothetical protein